MFFELVGEITDVEVIAKGGGIDCLARLRRDHGGKNWRKMKGKATVILESGSERRAEVHWYEAQGVGRVEFKIKRLLGE